MFKKGKKINKKVIAFIFALVAILIPTSYIFAAKQAKFSLEVDKEIIHRGDEVTINVDLSNVDAYSAIGYRLSFDSEAFEYVDGDTNLYGREYLSIPIDLDGSGNSVTFTTGVYPQYESTDYNGTVGYITLRAKENAAGKYDFKLEVLEFRNLLDAGDNETPSTYEDIAYEISETSVTVEVPVTDISLSKDTMTLVKGTEETIEVTPNPTDTTVEANISYSSVDDSIVSVDEKGVITAKNIGTTKVMVNAYGIEKEVSVKVINPITSVTLDKTALKMSRGDKITLTATINPSDTDEDKTITWTSSDSKVATVSETGLVTAVGNGKTTIKATTSNGVYAECVVNVVIPITEANINHESLELNRGETETLKVTYSPIDTTEDTTVTYEVKDTSIATIDNQGVVTAVNGGNTTITVKMADYTFTVAVKVNVPITSVTLNEESVELLPTQSKDITATVNPIDTTENKDVKWTSENPSIATVDENGKITAVAAGTTKITAQVGTHTANVRVKVLVPIESVFIKPSSEITLEKNKTVELSIGVYPEDAEEDKTVTWASSNESVATVNNDGVVTAVAGGKAEIIGTLKNGKEVKATINVVVPMESIELNKKETNIAKGATEKLTVTINPIDTTDSKDVKWTSENPSIATVDNNGEVTAVSAGQTTIVATVGEFTARTIVNVTVAIESIKINQNDMTLNRNETASLTATINPSDTTEDKTITWSSSNDSVATVDNNGVVTAVSAGTATIKAQVGTKEANIKITVVVPIQSFQMAEEEVTIIKGENNAKTLSAIINPSDTTEDKTITWTTSDASIAKVDANGKVTGVSAGDAIITAKLKNGLETTTKVTVEIIELTDIEVPETLTVNKGQEYSIIVKPMPANTTEFTGATYETSDSNVATVDATGKITGIAAGIATITVKVDEITKEIKVEIKEIPAESIELKSLVSDINIGETTVLQVVVNPTDTTDKLAFTYESSDLSIATVDASGKVSGLKEGKVTITVTADNGMTSQIELTINKPKKEETVLPGTGVSSYIPYMIMSFISLALIIFLGMKRISLSK